MKLSCEEREILEEIKGCYKEIEDLFEKINSSTQEEIFAVHNEHGTLQHCNRWGLQAVTEILRG